jgi:uncharacterized repeat protein (TIGR01451 family)
MVRVTLHLTRKSLALLTSLLLVLFWVPGLIAATPARADAGSSIPGSPYNGGDGTIPDSNTSIHSITDPAGNSDTTSFTGGKEDDQCPGVTTQGLSSPKDDLTKVYFGSENGTTTATNSDVFLYLAWERSTTSGTTTIDFELNQASGAMSQCNGVNPERTQGDLLFSYDFSNGGGNVDVNYYTWDTSLNKGDGGWKSQGDITSLVDSNSDPVVEAATDATGIKGEMAVNLSLLPGVFTSDTCKDFGTAWGKTRSSTSFSSEIKDYVTPQPSVISNCAPLEILKEDSGTTPLPGATFSIAANAGTHAVPSGQSPCTTRSDGYCYVEIPNSSPTAYAFPLLFPGSYHVVETAAPPGYFIPSTHAWDVTVPQATDGSGNILPLTVHDPLGSLTFYKVDAQSTGTAVGGASFLVHRMSGAGTQADVSVTDQTPSSAGSNDDSNVAGTMTVSGLKSGTYRITETTPLPAGYGQDSSTIYITIDQTHQTGFLSDSSGNPIAGTATFQDPRLPVTLRVIKTDGSACDPANPSVHCLAGAVFKLYQLTGSSPDITADGPAVGTCTTDSTGSCTVTVAHWGGTYYWYEYSAPTGYNLPANRYSDTIDLSTYPAGGVGPSRTFADNRPTLSTAAQTPVVVGETIHDTATLGSVPTHAAGTITFKVYGPFAAAADITDTSCTPSLLKATLGTTTTVDGAGDYQSQNYTTAAPGYYAWVASYSGDAATGAAAVAGVCGASGETSQVNKKQPVLATTAHDATTVTGNISDSADLSNFYGTVTGELLHFAVYTDSSCTGTVYATRDVALDASGHAESGNVAVDGTHTTYYWKVTFDEDANNLQTVEACGTVANHEISHAPLIPTPTKSPATGTVRVYAPDNTIQYTVTVQNTGLATAVGVSVTDPIDAGATFTSNDSCTGSVAGCAFTQPSGVPTWTFDLAAGGTVTIKFTVTAKAADTDGQHIYNTATVHNGTYQQDTNTTDHTVIRPLLALGKNANPLPVEDAPSAGTVAPGQTITYTLPLSNTGSDAANGVVVTDQVPTHTTYSPSSAHCENHTTHATIACTAGHSGASPDVVTWTVDVPAHTTVDVVFSVIVDPKASLTNGDEIWNQGSFTWTYSTQSGGPNLTGDSRRIHHVVTFPIISASKAATPDWIEDGASGVVVPGGTIHYVVTVHNGGLADATGVPVSDAIPAGTTYYPNSAVPAATLDASKVLHWTVDVAAGQDTQVAFDVTVDAGDADGQLIHNTAVVNGTDTNTTSHIVEIPIMSVAKSSSPASGTVASPTLVGPNTVITYTLTVTNAGRYDASGFVVTDSVPTGTTYNNDASCNGAANCSVQVNSGVITWTLDVPGGTVSNNVVTPTTRTLTFSVTTPTVQSFLIDNTATFPNTNTPGCETQTCDTETTHHEVVFPVINAVKSSDPASGTQANPATVTPNQVITYTIAVTNSGEADATGVVVHDSVPANTTYVAGSADNGGTVNAGVITWTIDVAKGTTVNLTFQAQVPAGATNGTLIDNTATFTNVHTPGCEGETCSTDTTHHEVRFPILTLAKSSNPVSGSIVQRGDRIDYTITLANTGLDASAPTTVTDTLPTNVTIVSGSANPAFTTVNGNVVTWTVTVPAGQTQTLTYGVTVNSDAPQGATLTNVALVNGQCVGNADESACTTDHHVPTGALTLVKHVDKTTAAYGDTLTYTFDASTTGALDQTGVVVTDVLPKGTAYVNGSAACTDGGTCTASYSTASKTVTWQLGDMAAGTTRHLVFKVTIVKPSFNSTTGLPATTIVNSGAVQSNETPSTPSNQVVTKVVAVLGVKVVRPPVLAFTGLPAQVLLTMGLLMLGAGIILTSVRRKEQ